MSTAIALVRSLKAEERKTVGLPGAWLGVALAIMLPTLIEYYSDRKLPDELANGDLQALAKLDNVGVTGIYFGTAGIVVLAASVVVSEYAITPHTNNASRQVTTTMLIQPRRGAAIVAKLLVVLAASTVIMTLTSALTLSLCEHLLGPWISFDPLPWQRLVGLLCWWIFSAIAAMALAVATRNALASMTLLIAMSTMISPGLIVLQWTNMARFLPDTAAVRIIASPTTLHYDELVKLLSIPMAAYICAAWAGGCATVCCWVWMRRDT